MLELPNRDAVSVGSAIVRHKWRNDQRGDILRDAERVEAATGERCRLHRVRNGAEQRHCGKRSDKGTFHGYLLVLFAWILTG